MPLNPTISTLRDTGHGVSRKGILAVHAVLGSRRKKFFERVRLLFYYIQNTLVSGHTINH